MTKLTNKLNQQLKNQPMDDFIKEVTDKTWTSKQEFAEDVKRITQQLTELKIGYQDMVLVSLENSSVYPAILQALWQQGVIVHPVSESTPVDQLLDEYQIHHCVGVIIGEQINLKQTVFVSTTSQLSRKQLTIYGDKEKLALRTTSPVGKLSEANLALVMNTSGTTGKPKRVGLTHEQLFNGAKHIANGHQLTERDTTLVTMPMFHINAQVISILATRLTDGRLLVAKKFSAHQFWQQVADNQVTWASVVPTIISILLMNLSAQKEYQKYQKKLQLRFIRSASFSLPKNKLEEFQTIFDVPVIEGYGLTEGASQVAINPHDAPKAGSVGKPYGTEIKIFDGTELIEDSQQLGEIAVRGDHVITDYLDPNPTSFFGEWFLTGDLGYFDEEGYLYIKGRKKEMINRGGEKIAPVQVEGALNKLSFIAQIAVVGLDDPLYGEEVTAVVISRASGISEAKQRQAIFDYSERKLARYERPTRVEFVKEFPTNPTGKVIRAKLKEIIQAKISERVENETASA